MCIFYTGMSIPSSNTHLLLCTRHWAASEEAGELGFLGACSMALTAQWGFRRCLRNE